MVISPATIAANAEKDIFAQFRDSILSVDPVAFCENNLTLDGAPFRLRGNGYKPFSDIYRYIALEAIKPHARPVVMVKGRQVGATTMASALECYFMACGMYGTHGRAPMRILHLFPTLALAAAYTKDKLDPMFSSAKPIPGVLKANGMLKTFIEAMMDTNSPANSSLHYKKFLFGNQIWIESTGLDGGRIRGRTADCGFFDEVQDMNSTAIGAVTKILTQAKYGFGGKGVQVYFGTPKMKGSPHWKMWQKSSQQYYHLCCEKCGGYFPLYRPDVNWQDVWLYGYVVKCTHCGHEQNKLEAAERGKWIPLGDPVGAQFVGYHINQLYLPLFSKEMIEEAMPANSAINTERIYMNEVLGEFYDGEGGTITREQLETACGERGRRFAREITPDENRRIYAGFDWGQRANWDQLAGNHQGQGQSFSCAVVLSANGPKLFSVEFATRLMRNDPQSKKSVVEEMFRRYSVHQAVGDIGDAFDLTHELQKMYYNKFLASRAAPKVMGHVKYNKDIFPKEIIFERDYYISELMGLLQEGAIKFPLGSFDRVSWLIDHCCSMEIKITRNRSGDPVRHYVKGATPNDGFMALLNAYLAWKYDVTQGFTIRQPQFMKYDVATSKRRIPAVLGFLPKFNRKL